MQQSIWKRCLILAALVCVAPALAWAQTDDLTARRLATTGWEEIATNVFQRTLDNGTVETVSWGLEGVAWELDRVQERVAYLESLRSEMAEPSPELLEALSFFRAKAREMQAELAGESADLAPLRPQSDGLQAMAGALGCNLSITRNAFAEPTSTGPDASSTAAFSDTCGTQGQVQAYAFADGIYAGAYRSNFELDPASGWRFGVGSASASASASVVATTSCSSAAAASVIVYDSLGNPASFYRSATNTKCRNFVINPGECLTADGLQACLPESP